MTPGRKLFGELPGKNFLFLAARRPGPELRQAGVDVGRGAEDLQSVQATGRLWKRRAIATYYLLAKDRKAPAILANPHFLCQARFR